jgi:3,4-dihydroxy 2-butanone 4-phosphate synthase/GTP cyclohydrolase II
MTGFSGIDEAISDLAAGKIIIVVDAEDRENEGDFMMAAEKATPESIRLMITEGCGHLCVPVSSSIAHRLALTPMVTATMSRRPDAPLFAMSVDHCGCRSGVSPQERALTIRSLAHPSSVSEDFVCPGHVFPIVASDGGVLQRAGHTEAAVELLKLANLSQAAVLCEICSRNGLGMANHDELVSIADHLELNIICIDNLIEYLLATQRSETTESKSHETQPQPFVVSDSTFCSLTGEGAAFPRSKDRASKAELL